MLMLS